MTGSADPVIETAGLSKRFGRRRAVDAVDLRVPAGSVFGFLGPNGAGKTTTIRMLLGLVAPDAGTVRLLGSAMPAGGPRVLPRVGSFVEGPAFYPYLSGTANLLRLDAADPAAARATAVHRAARALDRVGLGRAAGKAVHGYSLGMRQRLGLAHVLMRPRELLVLDEPTNGLDPQGTREVRALVGELAAEGTTVFVSSHLLAEIAQMCTHAAVMRSGRLVAQGTLDQLGAGRPPEAVVRTPDTALAGTVLARLGLAAAGEGAAATVRGVLPAAGAPEPEAVVAALVGAGVRVRGFEIARSSLEDRYVALTGEGFDVDG